MADMLKSALWYAKRGLFVFPMRPNTKGFFTKEEVGIDGADGKRHGGFKAATRDPATIRDWWTRWPDANIGADCERSGVAVLDADVKNGVDGYESLLDVVQKTGASEATWTVETPSGGCHLYYRANGYEVRTASGVRPGLDTRACGGLVILPPSRTPLGDYHFALGHGPADVDIADCPEALALALGAGGKARAKAATGPEGKIPSGARNATLASLAGSMRRRGMSRDAIEAALLTENDARCDPPLDASEVAAIAASVGRYAPAVERTEAETTYLTDLGNARRFAHQHAGRVRFCDALGGWLAWDGKRWARDTLGTATELAKQTVIGLLREAADCPEEDQRARLAKWALVSQSAHRIAAMLTLAQSEPALATRAEAFDQRALLLTVANGTIDLATGELRPHDPDDLITKLAPVAYDPEARNDVLTRYLADATRGDADFASYLQRAAGYTLTGLTSEEAFFLVLGPAATGKSTLTEAMLGMLGDYAVKASFDTFLEQRNVGGARPDIARLRGARMVGAVETARNRHLAEAMVKEVVGGDTVTARYLYHDPVSFRPECKVWLAANDAPTITDTDTGLWRRLRRVPFEHEVPEDDRDPDVKASLCDPARGGPALLAWAVAGCLAWQRDKLGSCDMVRTATSALRADMNPVAEFFESHCVVDRHAETPARALREAYESWATDMGAKPINNRDWGKRLRGMGCKSLRTRSAGTQATVWTGIGLVSDAPETDGVQDGVQDVQDKRPFPGTSYAREIQADFSESAVRSAHGAQPDPDLPPVCCECGAPVDWYDASGRAWCEAHRPGEVTT